MRESKKMQGTQMELICNRNYYKRFQQEKLTSSAAWRVGTNNPNEERIELWSRGRKGAI